MYNKGNIATRCMFSPFICANNDCVSAMNENASILCACNEIQHLLNDCRLQTCSIQTSRGSGNSDNIQTAAVWLVFDLQNKRKILNWLLVNEYWFMYVIYYWCKMNIHNLGFYLLSEDTHVYTYIFIQCADNFRKSRRAYPAKNHYHLSLMWTCWRGIDKPRNWWR